MIVNENPAVMDEVDGTCVDGFFFSDTGKTEGYNYFFPIGEDIHNKIMLACKEWNAEVEPNPEPGDPTEKPKYITIA